MSIVSARLQICSYYLDECLESGKVKKIDNNSFINRF
jgi:hypothetical protein